MDELIEVYSGNVIDAEIIKSIFLDSEIECFLKDEYMGTIAPWQASAGGAGAVKLIINSRDVEKARKIIDEFESNR